MQREQIQDEKRLVSSSDKKKKRSPRQSIAMPTSTLLNARAVYGGVLADKAKKTVIFVLQGKAVD